MNKIEKIIDFLAFLGRSHIVKTLTVILLLILVLMNSGCGHNMLIENETIGFAARVPVGDANYVGVVIGSSKQVVAAVRGGASFESTTSAGGGIFSASGAENKITTFRSNLQFNEGNLNDAFANPDVPMDVKLKLAEGVVTAAKAPKFPDSIVTTRDAVMQLGAKAVTSNAVSVANLKPTGVDNVVNKTPDVVKAVTDPVTETVHDLVNPLEGTISSTTNVTAEVKEIISEVNTTIDSAETAANDVLNNSQKALLVIICAATLAVCFVIIIICLSSIFKKKSNCKKVHVGHHLDDMVDPSSTPPDCEVKPKTTAQSKPEQIPLNWFQNARFTVFKFVIAVLGFISAIPSPVRKKAMETLRSLWEQRKAAKKK